MDTTPAVTVIVFPGNGTVHKDRHGRPACNVPGIRPVRVTLDPADVQWKDTGAEHRFQVCRTCYRPEPRVWLDRVPD